MRIPTWITPDEQHESDLHTFADLLFDDEQFQQSFQQLFGKVAFYGCLNSLSQTLLKITAPGVPDFYRGTITWDFSLVDPDNRRPVDFAPLTDFSDPRRRTAEYVDAMVGSRYSSRRSALAFRNAHKELFESGEYVPLEVRGACSDNSLLFFGVTSRPGCRSRSRGSWRLCLPAVRGAGDSTWRDTALSAEAAALVDWKNKLTGERLQPAREPSLCRASWARFPVALLSCVG